MTKIYRLSVVDCENKCAYDIYAMSNEEKAQLIKRHKDVAEEFTMEQFFLKLNCSGIDMETSYWFFIDE